MRGRWDDGGEEEAYGHVAEGVAWEERDGIVDWFGGAGAVTAHVEGVGKVCCFAGSSEFLEGISRDKYWMKMSKNGFSPLACVQMVEEMKRAGIDE